MAGGFARCAFAFLWMWFYFRADGQEAELQKTDGVPSIKIDQERPSHLLFSGGVTSLGKPIILVAGWNKIQYSAVIPVSDPDAIIQINLGGGAGQLTVRNFSLVEETGGQPSPLVQEPFADASWANGWKFIVSEKAKAECELSPDGLQVTVDRRTDFPWSIQLARMRVPLKEGARYTVSFEIRSSVDGWPLTSYLMRSNPLRFYASQSAENEFFKTSKLAVKNGVNILSVLMPRMPWPQNPGDYGAELKFIGQQLDQIRTNTPEAKVILRFGIEPPPWWISRHSDQMETWENGKTGNYVCIASEEWLSEVRSRLGQFVRDTEAGWGDLIIGYAPAAQSTGEWYYPIWDNDKAGPMNFGAPFRVAYQKWLLAKYSGIDSLNAAWDAQYDSFEKIGVPSGVERSKSDLGLFRNPASQRNLFDFSEFQQAAMFNALDNAAKTIKEATGGKKLVLSFYGYSFELPSVKQGIGETGHLALGRLLRTGNIDGVIDIVSYADRGVKGSGSLMTPVDSILAHGRVLCTEDDSRTHLSALSAGYERTSTPDETRWAQSRNLLRSLIHNAYTWKFDLYGQGWFDDEDLWKQLGSLSRVYSALPPKPYDSDVAVIVDEASFSALHPGIELTKPLVSEFRYAISKTGAADPSWWLLEDVVAGLVPIHKLTIFLNAFYLSSEQRAALTRYCSQSGGTVLWMYAPGYLGDQGEDFAGMEALTGFRFAHHRQEGGAAVVPTPKGVFSALPTGTLPRFPGNLSDYFSVEPGDGVVVEGRFSGSVGDVALAARNYQGFRSLFCAAPQLTPEFLAAVEKDAGVWKYVPVGNMALSNGRILGVTCPAGGPLPIDLPGAYDVAILDGTFVATGCRHFVQKFLPGETRIFLISPAGL